MEDNFFFRILALAMMMYVDIVFLTMKMGCSLLFLLTDAHVRACLEERESAQRRALKSARTQRSLYRQAGWAGGEGAHHRVLFFARAHLARARVIGLTQCIIFARACT